MKRNIVILAISLIVTGLLGYPSMSLAQGGAWKKKADMPTGRSNFAVSAVNNLIYAIGGWDGVNFLSTVEVYNPATDKWTQKADMPTPRRWHTSSAVNGKIYVFGGITLVERRGKKIQKTLARVEVYHPAADAWEQRKDAPLFPRANMAIAALGGKIYVIGGISNAGAGERVLEAYDPATDTWVRGPDLIERRRDPSGGAVNGKIYALGGWRKENHWVEIVEEYDPATNLWTRKKDMPTPRDWLSSNSPAVGGKIYVIGGLDGVAPVSAVEAYEPATDTWTQGKKMPTKRRSLAVSAVKGKIYVIGGALFPKEALAVVEEYTPEGWPFAVSPQGKMATAWGTIKTVD